MNGDMIPVNRVSARRLAELLDYLADILDTERDERHRNAFKEYTDEDRAEIDADLESARGFAAFFKNECNPSKKET